MGLDFKDEPEASLVSKGGGRVIHISLSPSQFLLPNPQQANAGFSDQSNIEILFLFLICSSAS